MGTSGEDTAKGREPQVSEVVPELFHYTNISALEGILESNTLWGTRASHLNDLSEMQLIWPKLAERVIGYLEEEISHHLQRNPDDQARIGRLGGAAHVAKLDGSMMVNLMRSKLHGEDTASVVGLPFIVSFTTHQGSSTLESYHQDHGMLSQWRGYGGNEGVALVFNTREIERFLGREGHRFHYWPCYLADVVYDNDALSVVDRFPEFCKELRKYVQYFIRSEDEAALETLISGVSPRLPLVVGRIKHSAFQEEHEYRIVVGATPASMRDPLMRAGESPDVSFKPIHHRPGRCSAVPYIRLFEGFGEDLPIVRIIVGPSRNQVANVETVRKLVQAKKIKVDASETPYVEAV